jgi:imidazolonepropionase-like amidohydrolase
VAGATCVRFALSIVCAVLTACATSPPVPSGVNTPPSAPRAAFPSTYEPPPVRPTLIRNATILTGTGERLDGGDLLLVDGRVHSLGRDLQAPPDALVIDASGRWVTPGLIDAHSHMGVYASPGTDANEDDTEATDPVVAQVWAEHSIWPQDPGFQAALEGGVTTLQVLPGSSNLIAGRGVTIKNVRATTYQAMKFPGAPHSLKMACGENPKRDFGRNKGRAPATRMANVAGQRQAFAAAENYRRQWEKYQRDREQYDRRPDEQDAPPVPPQRDLSLETLVDALRGQLLIHWHCYRADEMATMLDLAEEFGFRIAAFHHAVEAYKIADLLAEKGVCLALWADWWGFKLEAYDGIQENIALVDFPANGCAIVHSDSHEGIQRLNQEAGKAMSRGVRAGFDIPAQRAIRWITANPAKALGIADQTGTIEPGKAADVVIWNRDPFSVYALAELVFIDGALVFDRKHRPAKPRSDFLLGQPGHTVSQ